MARKLTPEELERYKTDFDPPPGAKKANAPRKITNRYEYWQEVKRRDELAAAAKKKKEQVPNGQLSLFEGEKQRRGRPAKYNEETRTVTFRLPLSVIKKLRVFAALHDQTPGDVLAELIKPLNVPGCK